MSKQNADAIRHERELREMGDRGVQHERELRTAFDAHERELRIGAETAVEKARDIQFREYERRLEDMNEFRLQLERQAVTFLTVGRFEREHEALEKGIEVKLESLASKHNDDHELLTRLLTQVGTFRGIAIFLGLPGIVALFWVLLAAFAGRTVTGPGGFIP